MKKALIIVVLLFQLNVIFGQEHAIRLLVHPQKDSIVLRWAPVTPVAWQLLNKYGYRIERFTIVRDSVILETKPHVIIQPVPLKPKPQDAWMPFIDHDDYVAIAAQAIYGETFSMDMGSNNIQQIVNKARELESRFSFALFAADLSPKAASLSALRYVDKDVIENERYLYRVYSMIPENILQVSMAFAYTSPSEKRTLPPVEDVYLKADDKTVMITWNVRELKSTYSGYYIEKSVDNGQTYQRINKYPYVLVEKEDEQKNIYGSLLDSLQSNDKEVSYRIIGITPFADLGPPSKAVATRGVDKTSLSIEKVTGIVSASGSIQLGWEFPKEKEALIQGFEVERSNHVDNGYKKVGPLLPADRRNYEDLTASSTNYYRVLSVDKNGKRKNSFPILLQKEDSIPPVSPAKLVATIDTTGVVRLAWAANTEPDLLGYRIYRSTFKNSEFSQVTVSPITSTSFIDTVNIKTLNKNCYYKITAVDNRFNTSPFSPLAELVLPDIIPPVPITIKTGKATEKGISLTWTRCSSDDAVSYKVYRRSVYSKDKVLVATQPIDSVSIVDMPPLEANYYYWVEVIDKNGLVSAPSKSLMIAPLRKPITKTFSNLTGAADRAKMQINLSWQYPDRDQLKSIQIYRYEQESNMLSLYKTIVGESILFIDKNITMNTQYGYRLKAIYKNGKESQFSEEISVKF